MALRPFLKWAGGKDKLFNQLENLLPNEIEDGGIKNYYEPFLGSGAVFFNLMNRCHLDNIVLSDINEELILTYKVVKYDVEELMQILRQLKTKYLKLSDIDKEKFYYDLRNAYNSYRFNINYEKYSSNWIYRASQMIFLNKTCYNGLYRQNLRGEFNVPFGKNYYPPLFDEANLAGVSNVLQRVEIVASDFEVILTNVKKESFVYLDPPYRPTSDTSKFRHYYKLGFSEEDNIRLAQQLRDLTGQGVCFMLNNSAALDESFIHRHYKGYNIHSIDANRMMSSIPHKRKKISEVVITNY